MAHAQTLKNAHVIRVGMVQSAPMPFVLEYQMRWKTYAVVMECAVLQIPANVIRIMLQQIVISFIVWAS